MTLRLVPKPEGFELRNKRSDKNCDSALWDKQDILYDASQCIKRATECDAAIAIWREKLPTGWYTFYRYSGPPDAATKIIINVLGKLMGWVDK